MWDLIVLAPDYCFSFTSYNSGKQTVNHLIVSLRIKDNKTLLLIDSLQLQTIWPMYEQVGFFKKNPLKRSAAFYLLCVCLSFPVSRK